MATKSKNKAKKTAGQPLPDEDLDLDELDEDDDLLDDDAEESHERDLAGVIAALGGEVGTDVLLKIYRKDSKTNKREWVVDAKPEDMPLEPMLQAEFGGGLYEVDVYSPTPGGSKSKKRTVGLPIATRREVPAAAVPQFNMAEMFKQLAESQAKSVEQIAGLLTLKMENMVLKAGGGAQPMGVEEMLKLFALFKELSPSQKSGGLSDMVRELAAMREVMPDLFGSNNGMTGWDAALKAMDKLAGAVTANGRPAALPPAAGGAVDTNIEQEEGTDVFNFMLRQKLEQLCARAAAGGNPAVYAQVVLDELPEKYDGILLEVLGENNDQAADNLIAICATVEHYRPWFIQFCQVIRAAFLPVEDLTDTGVPATLAENQLESAPDAAITTAAPGAGDPSNTTSHS
jgi:hypothetical protein